MATAKKKKAKAPARSKTKASPKKAPTKKAPAKRPAPAKAKTKTKTKPSAASKVVGSAKKAVASVVAKVGKVAAKASTRAPTNEFSNLVTPLDDRVLVLVEGESDRTAGGLYIPGTVAERPTRGRVVAVGRGARNKKGQLRPLDVVVGDSVLFAESAGTKLTLAGRELLLMRESDLLGVVG